MSVFERTVKLLLGALENAYYEGVKGGTKPGEMQAVDLTNRLVDLAAREVRSRG